MDANAQYELYLIQRELQGIINELNDIAYGVNRDFTNFGEEKCADCIRRVADKYSFVKRKLDNIDTNRVTDEYAAAHGGAGGGGGGAF